MSDFASVYIFSSVVRLQQCMVRLLFFSPIFIVPADSRRGLQIVVMTCFSWVSGGNIPMCPTGALPLCPTHQGPRQPQDTQPSGVWHSSSCAHVSVHTDHSFVFSFLSHFHENYNGFVLAVKLLKRVESFFLPALSLPPPPLHTVGIATLLFFLMLVVTGETAGLARKAHTNTCGSKGPHKHLW